MASLLIGFMGITYLSNELVNCLDEAINFNYSEYFKNLTLNTKDKIYIEILLKKKRIFIK